MKKEDRNPTVPQIGRTRSKKGLTLGRPKTRPDDLVPIPTRCPEMVHMYLKAITPYHYKTLTEMFEDMLKRFLDERPWEKGLFFRRPRSTSATSSGVKGATGWTQVNMYVPPDLADRINAVLMTHGNVTKAEFAYTAIYWWVEYIHPPKKPN